MFDSGKTGSIEKEKVRTILNTLGHTYDDNELCEMLNAEDVDGESNILRLTPILCQLLLGFYFACNTSDVLRHHTLIFHFPFGRARGRAFIACVHLAHGT